MTRLIVLVLILACNVSAQEKPRRVVQVLSGDLMLLESGERLRLMGADAPVVAEGKRPGQEPWATAAREALKSLVLGKEVSIDGLGLKQDEYGRRIGLVRVGELWVDKEMVARGHAVVQPNQYLDRKLRMELLEAQNEARKQGLGIWAPANPLASPPREFRAAHKLSEGDDSKVDAWKYAAKKQPEKITGDLIIREQKEKKGVDPKLAQIQRVMDLNTPPPSSKAPGIEQANLMYEALRQIKLKVDAGISMSELERLTSDAEARYRTLSGIDKALMGDFSDAVEGYRLALTAYQKSRQASGADIEKYKKVMSEALELADRAIELSRRRLEHLKKPRD